MSTYLKCPGNILRLPFVARVILQAIDRIKAKRILDIGCGYGTLDLELLKNRPSLKFTILDMDGEAVVAAMNTLSNFNVEAYETDFCRFKATTKWDLCLLNHVLEHMDEPVGMLRKASDLSPHVFGIVPNALSLHRIIGVELGLIPHIQHLTQTDLDAGHKRIYTPTEFEGDFMEAGLKIIDKGGVCLKPLSDKQMLDWSEKTLQLMFKLGSCLPLYCAEIWILAKR